VELGSRLSHRLFQRTLDVTLPLRIALIGAGIMGRQHCQYLEAHTDALLCAVADPGPDAAAFAAQRGVPCFAEHRQMLEQARPDAVIVANPNTLHVSTALDCLAAGVPVLLEKPVGTHLDEVRQLVAAVESTGVPVLVGHHRRHNPLIVRAHQLLQDGALGRLTTVTALWQLQKPTSYYDVAWRREAGAGMLLTNLIHDLDLLRHLCGEVRQVQAFTSNQVRGYANEDSVAVLLQFDNGALGTLTGSDAVAAPWSWELDSGENPIYPRQAEQPCYLLAGTEGALSIPQLARWQYAEPGAGWHQPLLHSQDAVSAEPALARQLAHFIQVARGQAEPLVGAADAARTLALVEAIRQAADSGRAWAPQAL
jgi:predicted dehydrogenase